MNLEKRIQADLITAMKAGEAMKRDTLRLAKTALKNESVAKAHPLTDEEAEVVLARLTKQLLQAADEFEVAGDMTRAAAERSEAELLRPYLPAPLSDTELATLIDQAVSDTGATSPADLGLVMAALKPKVGTRADGGVLAAQVRARLAA